MTVSRLLLIDYQNLYYRSAFSHKGLSHKGKSTAGLFGFIQGLSNLVGKIQPTRVVVCKDVKPYQRQLDFAQYKAGRLQEEDPKRLEEIRQNTKAIDDYLRLIRCDLIAKKGFEADDTVALLSQRHQHDYDEIVISSNDSDLYQLLDQQNLSLYLDSKKGFYDRRKFFLDFPEFTSCAQWVETAAIHGGHNGAKGIHGIGIKTAVKIVTNRAARQQHEEVLQQHKRQIRLNMHLCKLPYPPLVDQYQQIMMRARGSFDRYVERDVIRFLSRFGITFTAYMAQSAKTIARGNHAI